MYIKLTFRFLLLLIVIVSCERSKYIVYNKQFRPRTLNLAEENTRTVLIDFYSCSNCLDELVISKADSVNLKIVVLTPKNKFAAKSFFRKHQEIIENRSCSIYFQFSQKRDSYSYRTFNRLFRNYSQKESPVIILAGEQGIKSYTYNEYVKEFNIDSNFIIEKE